MLMLLVDIIEQVSATAILPGLDEKDKAPMTGSRPPFQVLAPPHPATLAGAGNGSGRNRTIHVLAQPKTFYLT
jgi:hypothetical protein